MHSAVGETTKYDKVGQSESGYKHQPIYKESRSCTDVVFGPIFLICLGWTGYVLEYAWRHGAAWKITHGIDWQGNYCGVGGNEFQPYLYWCPLSTPGSTPGEPEGLDFRNPICIDACPTVGGVSQKNCPIITPNGISTGRTSTMTDYATHPVGKHFCLPQDLALLHKVNSELDHHAFGRYSEQVVGVFRAAWPVMLGTALVAILLSTGFLLVIECMATTVVWGAMSSLVLVPGIAGGYLVAMSGMKGGADGMVGSDDSASDRTIGFLLIGVAGFFVLVLCCMTKAIKKAVDIVTHAAECLFKNRVLLLEPVANLCARIAVWTVMGCGLALLISTGEVDTSQDQVVRVFRYSNDQIIYIITFIVMAFWLDAFVYSWMQYILANCAARWYFSELVNGYKNAPACLLCKAYWTAMVHHFGSLCLGSFIIAFTSPFRLIMLVLANAGDVTDNALCGCITRCFSSCLACCTCFRPLSKNAFIDIAISGSNFCQAGSKAVAALTAQGGTVFASTGATWVFTIAGTCSIGAIGAVASWATVSHVSPFNVPGNHHYVEDQIVAGICGGVISFVVALGFMVVFDTIADTLIICLAYDREELKKNPLPKKKEVKEEAKEEARPLLGCGAFASIFGTAPAVKTAPKEEARRPNYAPSSFMTTFKEN